LNGLAFSKAVFKIGTLENCYRFGSFFPS